VEFRERRAHESLEISGTDGLLSCSVFGNEALRVERTDGSVENVERPNPPHVAQRSSRPSSTICSAGGVCPSTGESARRTTRVMDQVLGS